VVALPHYPKLDGLVEGRMPQPAFYVDAMGSRCTTDAPEERLAFFDVAPDALQRLRGPVGLDIGARTPPEIAVSVAADLVHSLRSSAAQAGFMNAAHEAMHDPAPSHARACHVPSRPSNAHALQP